MSGKLRKIRTFKKCKKDSKKVKAISGIIVYTDKQQEPDYSKTGLIKEARLPAAMNLHDAGNPEDMQAAELNKTYTTFHIGTEHLIFV